MKVITAPDTLTSHNLQDIKVFLAGGISNCKNWQQEVIDRLKYYEDKGFFNLKHLVILNPRRDEMIDPDDEDTVFEQIKWEHDMLKECDIFSILFVKSESVQPISLYELGKWGSDKKHTIISVEKGYKRYNDVIIQTGLDGLFCNIFDEKESTWQLARIIALIYRHLNIHGV